MAIQHRLYSIAFVAGALTDCSGCVMASRLRLGFVQLRAHVCEHYDSFVACVTIDVENAQIYFFSLVLRAQIHPVWMISKQLTSVHFREVSKLVPSVQCTRGGTLSKRSSWSSSKYIYIFFNGEKKWGSELIAKREPTKGAFFNNNFTNCNFIIQVWSIRFY